MQEVLIFRDRAGVTAGSDPVSGGPVAGRRSAATRKGLFCRDGASGGPPAAVSLAVLFLVALVLVLGPVRCAQAFEDLAPADPNYPYVRYLVDRGVVKGYPDGTFRPAAPVTRAETAVLLARAMGLDTGPPPPVPTFTDLGPDHWAHPVVEAAARAGIFRGFPDGTFRPEEPVTRAQAAVVLLRLTKATAPAVGLPSLEDLDPDHWAAPAVAQALDAGLMHLAAPRRFMPEAPAGRLVLARGLATMLALRPESGHVPLEGTLVPVTGMVWLQGPGGASTGVTGPVTVTAGHRVRTGRDARAEVRFADGSGLRLDPETEIYIKEATGRATILRDGSAGAVVDRLVLDLPRGRIFGALAARYFFHAAAPGARAQALPGTAATVAGGASGNGADFARPEASAGSPAFPVAGAVSATRIGAAPPELPAGSDLSGRLLAAARWPLSGVTLAQEPSEEELPWWKTAFEEKIRVEVDMPWGVAGIRGTFWMNEVTATRQTTSVLDGRAEVTAAGRTVTVESGQSAAITAPTAAPTLPAPMTAEERQAWSAVREWVEQRAAEIQERAPVVTPPPPVTEQAPPTAERPAEVPPPPPPAPAVVQNVTASLSQVTGAPAPSAPGGRGGGGAPAPPADTQAPTWPGDSRLAASDVTQTGLTLTWTAASDNVGVTAYRIYRDGQQIGQVAGNVLTYPVTGLSAGTQYTFKVEAGDAAGNWSTDGPSVTVTTESAPPPPPAGDTVPPTWPAGSQVTAGDVTQNSLTLTWTAATDNVAVTAYRVYRDGQQIGKVAGNVLTYPVTGLSAGTQYTFKVEAGDAAGNWSTDGPSVTVTTQSAPPVGPAVLVDATPLEVAAGQTVEVTVRAAGVDLARYPAGIYGADVTLNFDAESFQPVDNGVQFDPVFAELRLLPSAGPGRVRLVVSRSGIPEQPLDRVCIATVTLRVTGQPGWHRLWVDPVRLATVDMPGSDPAGWQAVEIPRVHGGEVWVRTL